MPPRGEEPPSTPKSSTPLKSFAAFLVASADSPASEPTLPEEDSPDAKSSVKTTLTATVTQWNEMAAVKLFRFPGLTLATPPTNQITEGEHDRVAGIAGPLIVNEAPARPAQEFMTARSPGDASPQPSLEPLVQPNPPVPKIKDESHQAFHGEVQSIVSAPHDDLPGSVPPPVEAQPQPVNIGKPSEATKANPIQAIAPKDPATPASRESLPAPESTNSPGVQSFHFGQDFPPIEQSTTATPPAPRASSAHTQGAEAIQHWRDSLPTAQVAVRLSNGEDQLAVVRLMERAGKLTLSVSASHENTARALTSGLSDLSQNLAARGYSATFTKHSAEPAVVAAHEPSPGSSSGNPFAGQRDSAQEQDRPPQNHPKARKQFHQLLHNLGKDHSTWQASHLS